MPHAPSIRWRIALLTAVLAGLAFWAGWWLREQMAIDRCLDMGGRWSEHGGYCYGSPYGAAQP